MNGSEKDPPFGRDTFSRRRGIATHGRRKTAREKALVLALSGKHAEAGELILSVLDIENSDFAEFNAEQRKLAGLAAVYFSKANENDKAAWLLELLGEHERAEDLRSKATRKDVEGEQVEQTEHVEQAERVEQRGSAPPPGSAARTGKDASAGEPGVAPPAPLDPFRHAASLFRNGKLLLALDSLIHVDVEGPEYREAAMLAVEALAGLGRSSAPVEHFLESFLGSAPLNEREAQTLVRLRNLFTACGKTSRSQEIDGMLRGAYPDLVKGKIKNDPESELDDPVLAQAVKQPPSPRPRGEAPIPGKRSTAAYPGIAQQKGLFDKDPEEDALEAEGTDTSMRGSSSQVHVSEADLAASAATVFGPNQQEKAGDVQLVKGGGTLRRRARSFHLDEVAPQFGLGTVIAERYQLDSIVGQGGMAVVFEATDQELDEKIAIKVFMQPVEGAQGANERINRFKQELKLSRQLFHPNIIRLYDIGMHGKHRYITMELLKGHTLQDLLESPIDFDLGLGWLLQICSGLQEAHDRGVIHRDIKPENIFVTAENTLKIMDFGIAKCTYEPGLTMAGTLAGTPEFMAPEQINEFSTVTAAADQYSVGVLAYRMFTGVLPFQEPELFRLLMMQLRKEPDPPRTINPEIPEQLELVIMRMLEKDPALRFESCRQVGERLKEILDGIVAGRS